MKFLPNSLSICTDSKSNGGSVAFSGFFRLDRDPAMITMEVANAGPGVRQKARKNGAVASSTPGIGITSMRERASQLGGALDIQSNGCGTTVRVVLPLSRREPREAPRRKHG